MDLLENPAIEDVIVLSVVLEEAKHRNASAYQRLRKLCADPSRRFFVFANENHRCHLGNSSTWFVLVQFEGTVFWQRVDWLGTLELSLGSTIRSAATAGRF